MEGNKNNISKPLLRLAMLETCEPIWNDTKIIQNIKSSTKEDRSLKPIWAYFTNGLDKALANIRRQLQDYSLQDGILYFKNTMVVSDNDELQQQILRSRHDSPSAEHLGRAKTLDLVAKTFYWPTLRQYVN